MGRVVPLLAAGFGVAVAIAGLNATASGVSDWSASGYGIHSDARAPGRLVPISLEAGTVHPEAPTQVVVPPGGPPTHASGWMTVDLTAWGVPPTAKAAFLSFKGVITKGSQDGTVVVYDFARAPGSTCCQGPPGHENYPTDWNAGPGLVLQVAKQLARDTVRSWTTAIVPLVNGKFEFAWGYRRVEGDWPFGDAVGTEVHVIGWLG